MQQSPRLLKLTKELQEILGSKVTGVDADTPCKAMDTIHVGNNKLVVSPGSSGLYLVEIIKGNKTRIVTVATKEDAENSPYPSPEKFLNTVTSTF